MTEQTLISWTDFTVNFWEGCQKVGPGCDHCYAETRDKRFTGGKHWGPGAPRRKVKGGVAKLRGINKRAGEFHASSGYWPRVFCSSLSDVFDNAVDPAWRREAFTEIEAATDTRIQLLTKRVGNVFQMIPPEWVHVAWPSHVGLMITVVNQTEADRDIPKLLDLKARLGIPWVGLSIEPMLGPIDLTCLEWVNGEIIHQDCALTATTKTILSDGQSYTGDRTVRGKIDWVICGGESGPGARPMHPDWARSLRDQCAAADVPFHLKQWGEWAEIEPTEELRAKAQMPGQCGKLWNFADGTRDGWRTGKMAAMIGKKKAGRKLDGVTHDGVI